MLVSRVASDDITLVAVRNTYVAPHEDEALTLLQPRLQWTGGLALCSPVSTLARTGGLRGYEH